MTNGFFAMLSRMKYINRWGLMRNTRSENIAEHSLETAVLAHALCCIENTYLGGQLNAERAAVLALFHDGTEIITGDLPTPVKYHSTQIRSAYAEVETLAAQKLCAMLPEELSGTYAALFEGSQPGDEQLIPYVKAADKLSAIIKCMEEANTGNREFKSAEATLRQSVADMHLPAADYFAEHFLPAYGLDLDELSR